MNWLKLTDLAAVMASGLLAGVFFAFETAVNPALHRLPDMGYLSAMQHINRIIQNPAFLLVFMLPVLLLPLSAWQHWGKLPTASYWMASSGLYLVAVFGVTVFFNVPLNELLGQFDLSNAAPTELQTMRERYEMPWNRWHTIRTWAATAAFFFALLSFIYPSSKNAIIQ
jgi:uncharacterized membrane protein